MRLAGHQDAPPPQSQGAVQPEHGVAVGLLIDLSVDEVIYEPGQVAELSFHRGTAVLVPLLSPHSHRQVHRGQQAQHRADHQSGGISIIDHDLEATARSEPLV